MQDYNNITKLKYRCLCVGKSWKLIQQHHWRSNAFHFPENSQLPELFWFYWNFMMTFVIKPKRFICLWKTSERREDRYVLTLLGRAVGLTLFGRLNLYNQVMQSKFLGAEQVFYNRCLFSEFRCNTLMLPNQIVTKSWQCKQKLLSN